MERLKELENGWRRAAQKAEAYGRKINPRGDRDGYFLCEDWELDELDSLEREVHEWKNAWILHASEIGYEGGFITGPILND